MELIKYNGSEYQINGNKVTIAGKEYNVINDISSFNKLNFECRNEIDPDTDFKGYFDWEEERKIIQNEQIRVLKNIIVTTNVALNIFFSSDYSKNQDLNIILDSIFLENVTFKQSSGTIDGKFDENGLKILNFGFYRTVFEKEILIEVDPVDNHKPSILFNSCYFKSKLKIRNSELDNTNTYRDYQKHKLTLDKLHIKDCQIKDGAYLRIGFVSINEFILSNLKLPQNAELNIGDCHFKNFKISNLRNDGKFKLYKINFKNGEKGESFQINDSIIERSNWQNIDLRKFKSVDMPNNILKNIRYNSLNWGEHIGVGDCVDDYEKNGKQQELYRTLKVMSLDNNDQIQALIFNSKELQEYKKIIVKEKPWYHYDRISLMFNLVTNNFGLNWWRSIWLLLVISIFAYVLLLFSLDSKIGGFNYSNIELFFNKYLVFLDPLHKTENISKLHWGFYSYFINFAFRIIEGFLIYQTIQAFRKYSRKL